MIRACLKCGAEAGASVKFRGDSASKAPTVIATACQACGLWLKEANQARMEIAPSDGGLRLGELSKWGCFAAGVLYERIGQIVSAPVYRPMSEAPPEIKAALAAAALDLIGGAGKTEEPKKPS